ncbi:MAG: ABC transporter substrate-binding protein [Deltaproteobacteria bacterium]|nr:ABC transporter substrate-binding protein [Deltaproteobacteria bacterium]MBW2343157.1 ABC transporter substrate-binding protein [Deltaproteobacteria bacterium]
MSKRLTLFVVFIFICSFFVSAGWAKDKPNIKVGAAINLTGPISSWGQPHAKGQTDYFRYVNEEKGGVAGHKIEMILSDTGYKIPEAISIVKKFSIREKVDMISTWSTGEGIAVKPLIQKYKTPTINYSTGQEILKAPVDYMYLPFGSYILDSYAVMEYIRAIIHKGKDAPKVGLLTLNNAYGQSIQGPSKEYASRHNIDIVAIEEFPARTIDLSVELLKLKNKGAEYVFTQILGSNMIAAFKAADRIHYDPLFIGTWTATDVDFFKTISKTGKGLIRNRLRMQSMAGLPVDGTPGVKLMEKLIERYKSVDRYDLCYWEGIVIGMVMERAFLRADEKFGEINPETVNKALETFHDEDFGGLFPNITYTKKNHEGSFKGRIVAVNENGTFTPLTNFFVPGKGKIKLLEVE